jgi:hypothetical protein
VAEQVAKYHTYRFNGPSMHCATGSFRDLGDMPHEEASALDGQQMNHIYIKRPADTISLA